MIGIHGEYGLGVLKPKSGFFRKDPMTVLVKRCNTCGVWKPETSEFFYHDGKDARELGWRSEGYCKECRRLKEAMARSTLDSKQSREGNIQRLREEYESGKRKAVGMDNLEVFVTFPQGLDLEKTVENRDREESKHFIQLCAAMVKAATEEDSAVAREWLSINKARISEEDRRVLEERHH